MPQSFLKCVRDGGRVRSKRVNADEYIKICYLKGKSYPGEVHKYKKLSHSKTNSQKSKS